MRYSTSPGEQLRDSSIAALMADLKTKVTRTTLPDWPHSLPGLSALPPSQRTQQPFAQHFFPLQPCHAPGCHPQVFQSHERPSCEGGARVEASCCRPDSLDIEGQSQVRHWQQSLQQPGREAAMCLEGTHRTVSEYVKGLEQAWKVSASESSPAAGVACSNYSAGCSHQRPPFSQQQQQGHKHIASPAQPCPPLTAAAVLNVQYQSERQLDTGRNDSRQQQAPLPW